MQNKLVDFWNLSGNYGHLRLGYVSHCFAKLKISLICIEI